MEGLDLKAWEQDKNACQGTRTSSLPALKEQKNKLLGLDELDVAKLLGSPDEHELYKRNEKFFYYYLEPSGVCDSTRKVSLRLSVRFNAMGLAKEVMVE